MHQVAKIISFYDLWSQSFYSINSDDLINMAFLRT